MKVILMAAGRGTRISKYIGDVPKSMVDIGGQTLISHTIDYWTPWFYMLDIHLLLLCYLHFL